jgi:hypothetical protein
MTQVMGNYAYVLHTRGEKKKEEARSARHRQKPRKDRNYRNKDLKRSLEWDHATMSAYLAAFRL